MSKADNYVPDPWLRTGEPLLWMSAGGRAVRGESSYYYDARKRTDRAHAALQLTLRGQGFYQDARGRTALPPGRAFFAIIPGEFEYGFDPQSALPYEFVFISLIGPEAMAWYTRLTSAFGHVLDLGLDSPVVPQMTALAHARESGTLPDRYLQSGQLYQLMMTIYSTLNRTRLSTSPRVVKAIELIAAHGQDAGFGVNQLAGMMDCSREHLARVFLAATGVSPSDYLTQHRLRLAAQALRSSDEKLDLIAKRCGFSGANYLVRMFREHVGTTPAKFRLQPWIAGP